MPPGRQLGFLWGAVAVAIVLLGRWAAPLAWTLPACPLKAASGIPCLTCGTTRSALALARFDPLAAVGFNPLAAAGWLALVVGGLWAGAVALRGGSIELPRVLPLRGRIAVVLALLANWLYLLRAGI